MEEGGLGVAGRYRTVAGWRGSRADRQNHVEKFKGGKGRRENLKKEEE